MTKLTFEDLSFEEKKDVVGITFLRLYYTEIPRKELEKIGKFKITEKTIEFPSAKEAKAAKKFNFLLTESFKNLTNKLTKQKTIYIHQNSGIPLLGHNAFGLIDRNTSIIEVRCITGCNIDCVYCSVIQENRPVDFVVEADYLVQEFKKLVAFKQIDGIEAHIGTQGEPTLYAALPELIRGLSAIPEVTTIAMDTNGTLLTKGKVDELIKAGITRFNFSLNALDPELSKKIAHAGYNINIVLKHLEYISKQKVDLLIAPVWVSGLNDEEIPKIIELSKKLGCRIGIQNFLNYQYGRNPVKAMSWDLFIEKMKKLEKEHNISLLFDFKKDFNIQETKSLPKPFRKGNIIKAKLAFPGRLRGEKVAIAEGRAISVYNCDAELNATVKLKIIREKHNIFAATPI